MSGSICSPDPENPVTCDNCPTECQTSGYTVDECCPNWESVKDFTIGVSSRLDGANATIGESLVRFATNAFVAKQLSLTSQDTVAAVDGLVYTGGWTHHEEALLDCQSTLANSTVPNFILLITDGTPTRPENDPWGAGQAAATTVKDTGTIILPVYIANNPQQSQLDYMTDISSNDTVQVFSSFNDMNKDIVGVLVESMCDFLPVSCKNCLFGMSCSSKYIYSEFTSYAHP